jgi:RNA-splicing ligase RtcB
MWFVCRDEIPIIERSRANLYGLEWVAKHEASFNPQVKRLYQLLEESKSNPDLLWPNDHVITVAVRRVFNKLIAASGLDLGYWDIHKP